ncbi:hypothetical protein AWZ03_003254 [Drosophila navojoa]|uniref:Uncharacterized protein n=1 Tax=Drosophila navojoa TaxID=7232 RepID=A0A484BNF1_DRONA|nr:hypothetical protein AWZ03_003254 [Drosophila navojoa]
MAHGRASLIPDAAALPRQLKVALVVLSGGAGATGQSPEIAPAPTTTTTTSNNNNDQLESELASYSFHTAKWELVVGAAADASWTLESGVFTLEFRVLLLPSFVSCAILIAFG